ncbi:MAG: chorismate mutase [Bacteroidales bacterium]|nr:chorismate mutase [Bacteroidales bacterium]
MRQPTDCESIEQVREAIDNIDREIIGLLGKRFLYVKEVIRFKEPNTKSVVARERFDAVISSRRKLAEEAGLNGDIIEKIYRDLLNHFIEEELKLIKNK